MPDPKPLPFASGINDDAHLAVPQSEILRNNQLLRSRIDDFSEGCNPTGKKQAVLSPSGKFELEMQDLETGKGHWNYTRGTVRRVSDGKEIVVLNRNYRNFPHAFVQINGQEWLIAGRSYMSQTFVNLQTGQEFEPDGNHYNMKAFIWSDLKVSPDQKTLAVFGCVWGAPHVCCFFDISDPSKGWPEIPMNFEGMLFDSDYATMLHQNGMKMELTYTRM